MRLTTSLRLGIATGTLCLFATGARAGGGDGPCPLPQLTHADQTTIKTNGVAQEFQYWRSSNSLVYRNEQGKVYRTWVGNKDGGRTLTSVSQPLHHVAEPHERYLLTDTGGWVFDTKGARQWIQYSRSLNNLEQLFWDYNDLYAVASINDLMGTQQLRVYRYHAGDDYVVPTCKDLVFDTASYRVAKGHSFPFLYLYSIASRGNDNLLTLHRINVLTCEWQRVSESDMVVEGPVEGVFRFEKQNAVAVKVDNPIRNLFWKAEGKPNEYFDIGNEHPMIVNPDIPVVATASAALPGVTLYDFRTPETKVLKTTVLQDHTETQYIYGPDDLYLTHDGKELYARVPDAAGQGLTRLKFQGFLSDDASR